MDEKTGEFVKAEGWEDVSDKRTMFISEKRDFKFVRSGKVVVAEGPDLGRGANIEKERVTIGRSSGCDLVLNDPSVSYLHAELVINEDGHLLRDLGSTNGIFMFGHRIESIFLRPGSAFQVGNNLLRFEPSESLVSIPLSLRERFGRALGRSVRMRELFAVLEKAATSDLPILLRGETGTGKELLAEAIHGYSLRKNRKWVVLDCGSVPPNLIEDTLFGHEKGAFTGADAMRAGMFEESNGGSLFLDEVGELRLDLQPKLLRVLEQGEVQRLGGVRTLPVDVRIVSATHRNLWAMVDDGLFRQDLLYRLSVVEVEVPPLRERPEDIGLLVEHFLAETNRMRQEVDLPVFELDEEAMVFLQSHPWPGNVRELRNAMERAAHLVQGDRIQRADLMLDLYGSRPRSSLPIDTQVPYKDAKARLVEQFEREYLLRLMQEEDGNLSAASRRAGLARHHLRNLCRRYAIPSGVTREGED
jgi:DNA-binding NtrC family response regulator